MSAGNFTAALADRFTGKARRWSHRFFDSYHPELHYMRGPGPKWRQKHGLPPLEADLVEMGHADLRKAGI
jgi:hypothetical protein